MDTAESVAEARDAPGLRELIADDYQDSGGRGGERRVVAAGLQDGR